MKRNAVKKLMLACLGFLIAPFAEAQTPAPYPNDIQVNYIRTWDATAPLTDANTIMGQPLTDVKQATQYFDGLGRPLQTVIKRGSLETDPNNLQSAAGAVDVVSPVVYDALGREVYKYLPFAANNTGGNTSLADGNFKLNPFQQQQTFMQAQYGGQGETFFYSKTNYEASPLSRPVETYAPGNSWAGSEANADPAQRRRVQVKYWVNTANDHVKIWQAGYSSTYGSFGTYTLSPYNSGEYAAGDLFKNVTVDEHQKQVIEYKDKSGKVILKKVQLTAMADDGSGSSHDNWLCTYYIYDDLNNLRCVVQPEGVKALPGNGWQFTPTILKEQCFRYEYDQRNRMIMKKVPGADELYMVYDALDRLVLTQDANMRQQGKWILTKYDALNRPTETGLLSNATSFSSHLAAANTSTNYLPGGSYEILSLTHYDDYVGLPAGLTGFLTTWNNYYEPATNNWPYAQTPQQSTATKGAVTWTKTAILAPNGGTTGNFVSTVSYYDEKGRVIQVQSTNISGGLDVVTTQYSWAGQALVTIQKQEKQGANTQSTLIVSRMLYDELGRLVKTEKKQSNSLVTINGVLGGMTDYKTILKNEYDKLGQLKKKSLGTNAAGNGALETLNYDYNIRGWMLGMNRAYLATTGQNSTNRFGFELGYDKQSNSGGRDFLGSQYNGNITGMVWKSDGDDVKRKYDFNYDAANRLLKGAFEQDDATSSWNSTTMNYSMQMGDGSNPNSAYDANGNILAMKQYGWKLGTSPQTPIDDLTYTYFAGTNRLQAVADAITGDNKLGDFTDKNTSVTDYGYDKNGNLVTDLNKRINGATGSELSSGGAITYNHLNLPATIAVKNDNGSDKGTITYTYDAGGNKLQKVVAEIGQQPKTTLYLGGIVYEENGLQFIGHEEGRIRITKNALQQLSVFAYDYMLKDHLGNVRMVLTEEQKQDKYPVASLETAKVNTEDDYYAIDQTKIVDGNTVSGLPVYTNDNSIGNNPSDPTFEQSNSQKLYKLNSTTNKTGLGITLKVMAGDKIDVLGKSYYFQNNTGGSGANSAVPILDILNGLLGSPLAGTATSAHSGVTGAQINTVANTSQITALLTEQNNQSSGNPQKPKAFINVVFFDEQFKANGFHLSMVGDNSQLKDHYSQLQNLTAQKSGYVYIYVSNESPVNVFFDNLQVVHTRSPILEETHYYPFGLTMAGISSKVSALGVAENKRKYNSIEYENSFDINIGETFYRSHDPQLGRWWQIDPKIDMMYNWSPYVANFNNPITFVDPRGDWPKWLKKVGQAIAGVAEGAWDGAKAVGHMVTHPWQTVKNTFHAVTHPRQTINAIWTAGKNTYNKLASGDVRGGLRDLTNLGTQIFITKKLAEVPSTLIKTEMAATAVAKVEQAASRLSTLYESLAQVTGTVKNVVSGTSVDIGNVSIKAQGLADRFVVVGRDMTGRVEPFAAELRAAGVNAETWGGFINGADDAVNLANNQAWLNSKIANGYSVIDIGKDPAAMLKYGNDSPGLFYGSEQQIINNTQWLGTGTIWKQ